MHFAALLGTYLPILTFSCVILAFLWEIFLWVGGITHGILKNTVNIFLLQENIYKYKKKQQIGHNYVLIPLN